MKAIIQTGDASVELQDRERPTPDSGEVLVRVHTAGVCGSDVHAYNCEPGYESILIPRIMGHEYSGEVVRTGSDVSSFAPGDRVVERPLHSCGRCFHCHVGDTHLCTDSETTGLHRDGAYTDYVVVNPEHLHPVPEGIDLRAAAAVEPLSICTRAVFDRSSISPGDRVLVEGPGPIGALTALVVDDMGGEVIVSGVDVDAAARLPLLDAVGVETINVDRDDLGGAAERFTDGLGFDVVVDATGNPAGLETAVEHVRKGGQIVVVGLSTEPSDVFMTPVVRGELDLTASYSSTWENFEQAVRLLENGNVDPTHLMEPVSVAEPAEAFERFMRAEVCKPVFSFAGTDTAGCN